MKHSRRTHRIGETGSFWLSFSDMMSVLVLIFIFVIFGMLYSLDQTKTGLDELRNQYAAALTELDASKAEQQQLIILLGEKETELTTAQAELETAKEELTVAQTELADTKTVLVTAQTELTAAQTALTAAQTELADSKTALTAAQAELANANTTIILTREELANAKTQLETANAALIQAQTELDTVKAEHSSSATIIANLRSENSELKTRNETVTSQMNELAQKYLVLTQDKSLLENSVSSLESRIKELQSALAQKQTEYDALAAATKGSGETIARYENELALYKQQLEETQSSLEQMLGVKTRIIEKLSSELKRNNIQIDVDTQTGAISLSGGALFDTGMTELKNSGKTYLSGVLPVYFSVLMSDEFRPYIAEIVIEGHTDSKGTYLYNLELSQKRANAVSNYVLSDAYMRDVLRLSESGANDLCSLISASGRSYSALIYDKNGKEDSEKSRRVEIKFRLKDDETINATRILLGLLGEQ